MKYLQLFIICFISLTLTKPDALDTINLNLNIAYEKSDGIQGSSGKEISNHRGMDYGSINNGENNGYDTNGYKFDYVKNNYTGHSKNKYRKYGAKTIGKYRSYYRYRAKGTCKDTHWNILRKFGESFKHCCNDCSCTCNYKIGRCGIVCTERFCPCNMCKKGECGYGNDYSSCDWHATKGCIEKKATMPAPITTPAHPTTPAPISTLTPITTPVPRTTPFPNRPIPAPTTTPNPTTAPASITTPAPKSTPVPAAAPAAAVAAPASGLSCEQTTADQMGPFYVKKEYTLETGCIAFSKDNTIPGSCNDPEYLMEPIRIQGRVLDSTCSPVAGAIMEYWQAAPDWSESHPILYTMVDSTCTGFNGNCNGVCCINTMNASLVLQCASMGHEPDCITDMAYKAYRGWQTTGTDGSYQLNTVRPGIYEIRPIRHIHMKITGQTSGGSPFQLVTQLYLPQDEPTEGESLYLYYLKKCEQYKILPTQWAKKQELVCPATTDPDGANDVPNLTIYNWDVVLNI